MRHRRPNGIGLGWGFVDQGFSSLTNLGLSVLAGRLLGPRGLGNVFIGFTLYTLVLEFQRSLLQEPYVVAAVAGKESPLATKHALTIGLTYEVLVAAAVATLGAAIPGAIGRVLLEIAPWIVPLLFQDLCRSVLFKDRRGGMATAIDAIWAATMIALLPLVVAHRTPWFVIGVWGAGATAGAILGLAAIRRLPGDPRQAWSWWRAEAAPLGRWLGLESAALVIGSQGAVFLVATLVAGGQLGGLRAVQSAFAPMTLVGPALRMPGLPAIARASARGDAEGQRTAKLIAARLSAAAFGLIVVYFIALETAGGRLLTTVFGRSFRRFNPLILPVGVGQLAGAAALGFYVLLRAQARGRTVFRIRLVTAAATFILIPPLTLRWGVSGAAWGSSLGAVVGWALVGLVALHGPSVRATRAITPSPDVATANEPGDVYVLEGETLVGGVMPKVTGGIGP
jgi:O-antigen/teichoic acid export membrane protein